MTEQRHLGATETGKGRAGWKAADAVHTHGLRLRKPKPTSSSAQPHAAGDYDLGQGGLEVRSHNDESDFQPIHFYISLEWLGRVYIRKGK